MYMDAVEDLRIKRAWNKWCPLNLRISLTPQRGGSGLREINAKVDLHIVCSDKYPYE